MNKELIKKYKAEFEHWLNGGEVLFFYWDDWFSSTKNPKMTFNHNNPEDVKNYIINDEYVEFRKALAEGKTIQVWDVTYQHLTDPKLDTYDWRDFKSFTQSSPFTYPPERYRIKPEEPQFKVGDWVVNKRSKQRIIKKVTSVYSDTVTVGDSTVGINVMLIKDFELWLPKPGEWCWCSIFGLVKVVCETTEIGKPCYLCWNPWKKIEQKLSNLEPFIGTLPAYLRD